MNRIQRGGDWDQCNGRDEGKDGDKYWTRHWDKLIRKWDREGNMKRVRRWDKDQCNGRDEGKDGEKYWTRHYDKNYMNHDTAVTSTVSCPSV
ncbi:hypothetical protein AOLI_G00075680 [Acnodon oligacanthus]